MSTAADEVLRVWIFVFWGTDFMFCIGQGMRGAWRMALRI
jgi:hypothetical protein